MYKMKFGIFVEFAFGHIWQWKDYEEHFRYAANSCGSITKLQFYLKITQAMDVQCDDLESY